LFLAIIQFTFQLLSMPAVAWLYLRRWRRWEVFPMPGSRRLKSLFIGYHNK
jgi:hypothetical protein